MFYRFPATDEKLVNCFDRVETDLFVYTSSRVSRPYTSYFWRQNTILKYILKCWQICNCSFCVRIFETPFQKIRPWRPTKKVLMSENIVNFHGNSNQSLWNWWRHKQLRIFFSDYSDFSSFVALEPGSKSWKITAALGHLDLSTGL